MKATLKCVLLIFMVCFYLQSNAQLMLDDINLDQIQQSKISKHINFQEKKGNHLYNDIQLSWNGREELPSYKQLMLKDIQSSSNRGEYLSSSYRQLMLGDINLDQIQQKKIRKYIVSQMAKGSHSFNDIQPSWKRGEDKSSYMNNEVAFIVQGDFQKIWEGYIEENPSNSWNTQKVSFGVLLQKSPNRIFYNHDLISGIHTGQIYYLNLKVFSGISNIPVAFEVITVDVVENVIEFSYIKDNKSTGFQHIEFTDIGDNRTKILHTSYYKSNSKFRDKYIYPFFHKKIVKDFHRNMRKLLKLDKVKKKTVKAAVIE